MRTREIFLTPPRSRTVERTLRRCRNGLENNNSIVHIDLDSELGENVIILDDSSPNSFRAPKMARKDKNLSNIIFIDVDDEEAPVNHHSGVGVNKNGFSDGASTSRNSGPSSSRNFVDFDDDDVEELKFDQKNATPVRLSKGKRTYSGNVPARNRYGLSTNSEEESGSDDGSDCELMEGSSGKLQEQWQKAFVRRTKGNNNGHSGDKSSQSDSREKEHQRVSEPGGSVRRTEETSIAMDSENLMPKLNSLNMSASSDKQTSLSTRNGDGDGDPSVQNSLINVRERLKETDEYKKALEEEWASRQQALQIQAEEAQRQRRLQKREKAESTRLLDMERRQKERLEEIRNTQKEVEVNMNLKEVIRAEVRLDLKKLEVSCRNMASLLNSLGIRVGGWPNSSPQEVQTAYKKALLTFHPDRASRSDIRQQVEAEEKFKLINRLKEIYKV